MMVVFALVIHRATEHYLPLISSWLESLCVIQVFFRPCLVFEEKKFRDTVAISFVCGNYCLTID